MNRRAFLGSGIMSLFVGVFAVLMGGGLPRPRQRDGKAVPIGGGEAELGITPVPDHLRILKPWDGKPLQEAEPITDTAYGYYDSDPRVKGPEDIEAFKEAWQKACSGHGYAVPWDAPTKATPLADMRRTRNIGRQFGLG